MWIHLPSSHYAQEQADSNLESNLQTHMLERFATLNGKSLHVRYWQRAWRTRSSMKRLSGLTCEPSTASLGMERFIASLPDIPVSPSQGAANTRELETPDISGLTSPGLSGKSSLLMFSLKTSPIIFPLDSRKYDPNYKRWALMLKQESSQRQKWARLILGKDCLFWGTPRADPSGKGNAKRAAKMRLEDMLAAWVLEAKTRRDLKKFFRPDHKTGQAGNESSKISLRINPHFLTWMMNWPRGWTNPSLPIEPQEFIYWEMASYQRLRLMLSAYSIRLRNRN